MTAEFWTRLDADPAVHRIENAHGKVVVYIKEPTAEAMESMLAKIEAGAGWTRERNGGRFEVLFADGGGTPR